MNPRRIHKTAQDLPEIDQIRLVADLRIMHSKVDELHHIVTNLKKRHREDAIHKYSDRRVLADNIRRVDEIYLWFLSLNEDTDDRKRVG